MSGTKNIGNNRRAKRIGSNNCDTSLSLGSYPIAPNGKELLIVAPARKPSARSHGISSGHNHPPTSIQVTATEDWEQLNQHPPAAATEDWEQLNQHPPAALNRGYETPHRTTREKLQQSNIS
ncbi:3-phosphoinositide-dependent protein kinase 2-like [Dorcoceras hygrometricum]|uniref:3-phosphoinositide-dependent protein kinase 2-like n=1 Tax=Dorcoceras hygrometricum TaxID=472368 RepID=A0A2Z7A9P7_9LAMI|nr:3-phosphoinositide-dependent protein kinase 2-like [Dorcoceras hygrometricum]